MCDAIVSAWSTTLTMVADIRNLSITIVTAITSTIAMKHVTFVIYNCEPVKNKYDFCV